MGCHIALYWVTHRVEPRVAKEEIKSLCSAEQSSGVQGVELMCF